MAIQIFGTSKCFDTKKAERWFSERNISVQKIDLKQKSISKGELESVVAALAQKLGSKDGAIEALINTKSKDYASIAYLADEDKLEKLLEQPALLVTPIVRNGKTAATAGFCPDTWKTWN
ncbi:MAG: arsenate reductase family protein [Spirochaetaceae bacterium]|nr:arsenate reductase family protein [Spirochaetaceae bacterium]